MQKQLPVRVKDCKMGPMSKPTITEFLEARIAQDEELASAALVGMHGKHEDAWDWGSYVLGADRDATPKQDEFITEFWPARVLAECAAKRKILAGVSVHAQTWDGSRWVDLAHETERAIASVYKDHPEYQPEWTPSA